MKAKLLLFIFSFAILTGCASTCSTGSCGGCVTSYWSTDCPLPNSGGASEEAFTDIANICQGDDCGYRSCNPCSYSVRGNCCGGNYTSGPNWY